MKSSLYPKDSSEWIQKGLSILPTFENRAKIN